MPYALIDAANAVLRYQDFEGPTPALASEKGLRWLPVEEQRPTPADGEILDGPIVTVEPDKVRWMWRVVAPPRRPRVATMLQVRTALLRAGLLTQVDAAAAAAGGEVAIAWEYATEVVEGSPMVIALAAAVGLDDEQVSALFEAAISVELASA